MWTPPHFWALALCQVRRLCPRRRADDAGRGRAAATRAARSWSTRSLLAPSACCPGSWAWPRWPYALVSAGAGAGDASTSPSSPAGSAAMTIAGASAVRLLDPLPFRSVRDASWRGTGVGIVTCRIPAPAIRAPQAGLRARMPQAGPRLMPLTPDQERRRRQRTSPWLSRSASRRLVLRRDFVKGLGIAGQGLRAMTERARRPRVRTGRHTAASRHRLRRPSCWPCWAPPMPPCRSTTCSARSPALAARRSRAEAAPGAIADRVFDGALRCQCRAGPRLALRAGGPER